MPRSLSPEDAARYISQALRSANAMLREAQQHRVIFQQQDKDGAWIDVAEINGRTVMAFKADGDA